MANLYLIYFLYKNEYMSESNSLTHIIFSLYRKYATKNIIRKKRKFLNFQGFVIVCIYLLFFLLFVSFNETKFKVIKTKMLYRGLIRVFCSKNQKLVHYFQKLSSI